MVENIILLILLLLTIFFIIYYVWYVKKNGKSLDNILLDTSLFFDIIADFFNKNNCVIRKEYFHNFQHISNQILKKLAELNYRNSKIIMVNRFTSLTYEDSKYDICYDYNKYCEDSKFLWDRVNIQFGKRLPNNLVVTRNYHNNIVLFKTYKCKNDAMLIIGLVLR